MFPSNRPIFFRMILLGLIISVYGCLNSQAITPPHVDAEISTREATVNVPTKEIVHTPTKEIVHTPTEAKDIQLPLIPLEENSIPARISYIAFDYIAYDRSTTNIGILGQDGERSTVVENGFGA